MNLFQLYSKDITQYTQLDKQSIMLYPIPKEFTTNGYEVGWNKFLSPVDKEFIGYTYPKAEKPVVELDVDGPPSSAPVGNDGEDDWYIFTAKTAAQYVIETQGWTNVVMRLFGPNDQTNLITHDDDVQLFVNARVAAQLTPGTYWVSLTHHGAPESGNYQISVKTQS